MESTLKNVGDYVILTNESPYLAVKQFNNFSEVIYDTGTGTIVKREFRYSFDNKSYSEYQELSSANLKLVTMGDAMYFQFRYLLLSGGPVKVVNVSLQYDAIPIDLTANYTAPDPTNEDVIYAFPVIYREESTWEPYKLNRSVRLYKDLNLMVNTKFGHDIWYFRYNPDVRSLDVQLMEYSLGSHEPKACIKAVVPNNQFPDNKLNMGPFGPDFDLPFEIQMDKDYFQQIFGRDSGPQKRDVIFFPRTMRIYEVSSSYLFRDFMNVPLYFKISLIKWQPKHNTEMSEDLMDLESFTVGKEKLFGEQIREEENQALNVQQHTTAYQDADPVRSYISKLLTINEEQVLNYYTVISESHYSLGTFPTQSRIKIAIGATGLTANNVYYVRPYSGATGASLSDIQDYYSQRKLTYYGTEEGFQIFGISAGSSQLQLNVNSNNVFGPTSSFYLYPEEFSGVTGSTSGTPILSCETSEHITKSTESVVKYGTASFTSTSDRSFTAWFRLTENLNPIAGISSMTLDTANDELVISYDRPIDFIVGEEIILKRASGGNFLLSGTVTNQSDSKHIRVLVYQELLDYVTSAFSTWQSYTDITMQKAASSVIVSSMNVEEKGVKIEIIGNRYILVKLNNSKYFFNFPATDAGLSQDVWYAIVVNVSNTFSQLTTNIWKMQWNSTTNLPATTDLTQALSKTVKISKVDRSSDLKWSILPSSMDLTNIRIFDRALESDKQVLILNQNIVKDAQRAIVIDNCLPQQKLPYIGYTR